VNTTALHDIVIDHMTTISLIARALPEFSCMRAEEFLIRLERSADGIIDALSVPDGPPEPRVHRLKS
jgi:hypothetical protein